MRFRPFALLLLLPALAGAADLQLDSGPVVPTAQNGRSLEDLLEGREVRHVLVQLNRIPNARERETLAARGVELTHYVPVRGYLARVESRAIADPAVTGWIEWSAALTSADKQSQRARLGAVPDWAETPDGRARIVVRTFPTVSEVDGRNLLIAAGLELTASLPEFRRFEGIARIEDLDALASVDEVRWLRFASPPYELDLDGVRQNQAVNAVQEAPYNLTGADVDVGEIDGGGADQNHDDLQGRITWVESQSTGTHATHVAGIVIGDGTLSETEGGTAFQWKGMATEAEIFGWSAGGNYLSLYDPAVNTHDIELSTNSWGWGVNGSNCDLYGDYGSDAPEHDELITGVTHGKRFPIFFSAGNERDDCDCGTCVSPYVFYTNIRPPGATAKNTMTIGAKPSDESDVALFSSWGPMDDGRLKPEIVASGTQNFGDGGVTSTVPGDAYDAFGGTSMSTPAAAGCAALFFEDFRALTATDPLPSTIKAHFCHGAKDMTGESYLTVGPDYASGFGVLKLRKTIDQLRTGDWAEDDVDQGESDLYVIEVPADATELKVTLAWDDVAGAENADPALVNDLDLVVTDPSAGRHYPWTLNPASPGDAAVRTAEDHLNPIEQVYVDTGIASGSWTVEVRGTTVPMGPQTYSLVFSHDGSDVVSAAPFGEGPALTAVTLHRSHPNPFRPWTTIRYSVRAETSVDLRIFDVTGRKVRTLVAGERQAGGEYTYTWRGRNDSGGSLPSGVYLVELRAGNVRQTSKVTLLR